MKIGVPREIAANETRVALIPDTVGQLTRKGLQVVVETGAGQAASYLDDAYQKAGAIIAPDAATVYADADMICKVQRPLMNEQLGKSEISLMKPGTVLVTFFQPLVNHDLVRQLADARVTSFSMDAIPRITRAQSMDALSSMSTIAGYKSVLMAAARIGRFFPLLMTAAGSVPPTRVFVLGAGVAGLMAIATARRLGAVVEAFDVRPAVKEQVESLGAKFVEMPLEEKTETAGGYATQLSEDAHKREVELLHKHAKDSDVIITTALIPGRPAPVLITADMVKDMKPGSVIVDLAAENGGNCELTEAGQELLKHNVWVLGPLNVPATMPIHASQLYSKNIANLLALLVNKEAQFSPNYDDEVVAGTCITRDGEIVHQAVRSAVEANLQRSAV